MTSCLLTLSETLAEPFGYIHSPSYLSKVLGVRIRNNEPEDIRAAVVEMFQRLEGTAHYDAEDLAAHERANRIYNSHEAFGMAQLSREFARRHVRFVT